MQKQLPLTLLAASLAALPLFGADPVWERLAFPGANFAAGARPAELARSPLAQELFAQAGKNQPEVLTAVGRQALASVDRVEQAVVFAQITGEGEASEPRAVAWLTGDFADGWLGEAVCAADCRQESFGAYQIYRWIDGGAENAVAISGRHALAGRSDEVQAAIARLESASPAAPSRLLEQAATLARRQFWIAAEGPFEAPSAAGAPPFAAAALDAVASFGAALDLNEDLELTVDVAGRSEAEGLRLHETVAGLLAMAAAGAADAEQRAFLEKVRVAPTRAGFEVSLRVPQQELASQVKAFAREGDATIAASTASPARAARLSPPAERGVIRIYGLGPEPVEVRR